MPQDISPKSEVNLLVEQLLDQFEKLCRAGKKPSTSDFEQRGTHLGQEYVRELHQLAKLYEIEPAGPNMSVRSSQNESKDVTSGFERNTVSQANPLEQTLALPASPESNPSSAPALSAFSLSNASSAESYSFLAPPQETDEIGRLGGYRILKLLGAGGMGMVFRAEDPHLKRQIAIKLMRPEIAVNPQAKDRFLREARVMASLENDYVVSVFQVGEDRGVPFLAMPLLQGGSLNQFVRKSSKIPLAHILRIGYQIAQGLAAAHAKGLIHRDIKPANIWIETQNNYRVKVLDFGLARCGEEDQQLTNTGMLLGTPAYMAPEQAAGKDVDGRCDLFSLGVVLYELLTGKRPFVGASTMATLTALAIETPAAPTAINSGIPQEVSDLVMKLLEKKPEKRFASAKELSAELAKLLRQTTKDPKTESASTPSVEIRATPRHVSLLPEARKAAPRSAAPLVLSNKVRLGAAIGGAIGLLALLIAMGVIYFRTPSGTLEVVIDDPSIEARFKNGALILTDESGKVQYTLRPAAELADKSERLKEGNYQLRVEGADGLTVDTPKFVLKSGDKERVRVILQPNPGETMAKGPAAAPTTTTEQDPERALAEWAFSQPFAEIRLVGDDHVIKSRDELPKTKFQIARLDVRCDAKKLGDAELQKISTASAIEFLQIATTNYEPATQVTDQGLESLTRAKFAPGLLNLALMTDLPRVSVHSIEKLSAFTKVESLRIGLERFGEAELIKITAPNLEWLDVTLKSVATSGIDAWLQRNPKVKGLILDAKAFEVADSETPGSLSFLKSSNLAYLDLHRMPLRDEHLAEIAQTPKLFDLGLRNTKHLSSVGVAQLAKCSTMRRLSLVYSENADQLVEGMSKITQLEELDFNTCKLGDAALKNLSGLPNLKRLLLQRVPVTQAGLKSVAAAPQLEAISIQLCPNISLADVQALRQQFPNLKIEFDGDSHVDSERALAEWAFSQPEVALRLVGNDQVIRSRDQLPQTPFKIFSLYVRCPAQELSDSAFQKISAVSELQDIDIGTTPGYESAPEFTDKAIEHLAKAAFASKLTRLALVADLPTVTTKSLDLLSAFPALVTLRIDLASLDGSALGHLIASKLTQIDAVFDSMTLPAIGKWIRQNPQLTGVTIAAKRFEAEGSADFLATSNLDFIDLGAMPFRDEHLSEVARSPRLNALTLRCTSDLTSEGVAKLSQAANLRTLHFIWSANFEQLDAGVAQIDQLEELKFIDCKLSDASLKKMSKLPRLKRLLLVQVPVTKAGITAIASAPQLESVSIQSCANISLADIQALRQQYPKIKIEFDGDAQAAQADPERELALWVLSQQSPQLWIEGKPDPIRKPEELPDGPLKLVSIQVNVNPNTISDDDYKRIAKAKHLIHLRLVPSIYEYPNPLVTESGIEALTQAPFAKKLTWLELNSYPLKLSTTTFEHLNRFESLQNLYINLTDLDERELAKLTLPKLSWLALHIDSISNQAIKAFVEKHSSLVSLELSSKAFSSPDFQPGSLSFLKYSQLERIDFVGMPLQDKNLAEIGQIPKLTTLTLRNTKHLTGEGLAKLANSHLKALYIYTSEDFDTLAGGMKSLAQLEELAIGNSKLGGSSLSAIAKLPNLKRLILSSVPITEKDLAIVATPRLEHLVIASCPNLRREEVDRFKKQFPKLKVEFSAAN